MVQPRVLVLPVLCLLPFILFGDATRAIAQPTITQPHDVVALVDLAGVDPVASNPYGIAFHPTLPRGYVALAGMTTFGDPALANGTSVAEFDLDSLAILRTFQVDYFPTDLVVSSDGAELFVVSSTGGSVARVDLLTAVVSSWSVVDSLGQPVGFPSGIAFSPDQTQLWITSNGGSFDGSNENLIILDRSTGDFVDSVEIVGGLGRLAVRADGIVVVPVGYPDDVFPSQPDVRIYDSNANWIELARLIIGVDIADFPAPADVVLSADGSQAFVSIFGGSSEIAVVDVDSLSLQPAIDLPFVDFAQHGLALAENGSWLYVSDLFASQVRVVDLASGTVIDTVPTAAQPNEIGIRGGRIWVTNQGSESVTVAAVPGAWIRSDANEDGLVDLADGIRILDHLFAGNPLSCTSIADVNEDGTVDVSDPVALFEYLFVGGATPNYPFSLPGVGLSVGSSPCPW